MMLICLFVTVSRDCSRLQCSTFTSLSDIRLPDQRKFLHPVNTSVHIPTLPLSRTSTLLSLSFAPACLHQTYSFILAPNFLHLRFSCTLHHFCMKQSRNYFHKSSLYRLCKSFPEAFFFSKHESKRFKACNKSEPRWIQVAEISNGERHEASVLY